MVRELYQRLREYFNNLPEPTEEERQFIRELNAGYFPITSVHRDDLEGQGFDVEKISDDDMQNLAWSSRADNPAQPPHRISRTC